MFQNDRKCFSHSNTQSISAGWCFYLPSFREPVKYCLADFVRRGVPLPPSFASKMITLLAHSPLPTNLCSEGDKDGHDDDGDCDWDGAVAVAPDDWDGDSGDADSRSERGPVAASQPGWASQSPPYQSTQSLEIERRSITIIFFEIVVFHSADEVGAKT